MARGFTIVEVLVVFGLIVVVAALTFASTRYATSNADTRAVALEVAEEFRLARQIALKERRPVGVVLPSSGATVPHSQSLYRLEGFNRPRVTYVKSFSKENSTVCLVVGQWPLDPTQLQDPTALNTTTEPQYGLDWGNFNMAAWGAPSPNDYIFVYMPSGALTSNAQMMFDNAFHIVISNGITYSGVAPCTLTAVGNPMTVVLTPAGEVTVAAGVVAAQAGAIQIQPFAIHWSSAPAAPPALTLNTAGTVSISALNVSPQPNGPALPAGVTAMVNPNGYLNLSVAATNSTGAPLFINWTASGGTFPFSSEQPMEWGGVASASWTATWEYRPPPGGAPGTHYTLACTVRDRLGGTTSSSYVVQLMSGTKIWFPAQTVNGIPFTGNVETFCMNEDGTNPVQLTFLSNNNTLAQLTDVSEDGRLMLYVNKNVGFGNGDDFVAYSDGTGGYDLLPGWGPGHPRFRSDGGKVSWIGGTPTGLPVPANGIYLFDLQGGTYPAGGTFLYQLVSPEVFFYGCGWSKDSSTILYDTISPPWNAPGPWTYRNNALPVAAPVPVVLSTGLNFMSSVSVDGTKLVGATSPSNTTPPGTTNAVWIAPYTAPPPTLGAPVSYPLAMPPWGPTEPYLDPSGSWIAFMAGKGGSKFGIYRMPVGGGPPVLLTTGFDYAWWPIWRTQP